MAVYSPSTGIGLDREGLGSISADVDSSLTMWSRIDSYPVSTWKSIVSFWDDATGTNYVWIGVTTSGQFELYVWVNGVDEFVDVGTVPIGQYFGIGYRYIAATGVHELYLKTDAGFNLIATVTLTLQTGFPLDHFQVNLDGGEGGITASHVRQWSNVALSTSQIEAELNSNSVVTTTNLFSNTPLITNFSDLSGNGNAWSDAGGVLFVQSQFFISNKTVLVPIGSIAKVTGLGTVEYYSRTSGALLLTRGCAVNGQILRAPVREDGVWAWDDGNTSVKILNDIGSVIASLSLGGYSLTQGGAAGGGVLFLVVRQTFTTFYTAKLFVVSAAGAITSQWDAPASGIGAGSPETSDTLIHQFPWGLSWDGSTAYYGTRNRFLATDYLLHIAPVGGGAESLVSQPASGYAVFGALGLEDGSFVAVWTHIGAPVPPHGGASGGTGAKSLVHYNASGGTIASFSLPSTTYAYPIRDLDSTSVWLSVNGSTLNRYRLSDGAVLNSLAISMSNLSAYGAIGNAYVVRVPIYDIDKDTGGGGGGPEDCTTRPGVTSPGRTGPQVPILTYAPQYACAGGGTVPTATDIADTEAWA